MYVIRNKNILVIKSWIYDTYDVMANNGKIISVSVKALTGR